MLLCLHTLRTEKAQMLDAHATALQAKEERMATELDQIRLAIASVQSSAHDAAGRMDDQWVEICSELEQLKDTLYITQAENDQLRCDMLAAEERLALAESVSLRAQAELESICNDLTAATSIEQESEHPCTGQTAADLLGSAAETAPAQQGVPHYQAASRMVGVYQGSAIVFVYETDTLTGPVYRKAVLMQEEGSTPSLRAAPTSLLGEGLQLLQAGSPAQVNTPAADEPLTAQSLNEALLRALTRAEEQVSRRAESKRLYHKAISQFAAAKGSLPATESSIASDAAMQLSRMLMEDQDVTGCMDAARLATDWARQGYGEQSPAVADAQRWLAQLLLQQGRVDDGMAAYRQTLTIRERTLGSAHHDTQAARSVLDTLAQQLAISA
jgi:tetratricopeptide (TPR) repeat protein